MGIKPPPSTRTYRSVEKDQDEQHFDAEYYVARFCRTTDDYDALWLATLAYRLYNPARRKRSVFPSACDVIDLHLGYDALDEEPVWESLDDRERSIVGLFAAQRLANLLEQEYGERPDELILTTELVTCPLCDHRCIDVKLGHKFDFDWNIGKILETEEIAMIGATVRCRCRSFGVSDIFTIENSAIEAAFEDFNA